MVVNNNFLLTKIYTIMKKFLKFAILFLMVPAFVLTSCKKDDDDDQIPERKTDAEFQTLITHLQAENLDLNNLLDGWITTAGNIKDNLDTYYLIDIRKVEHYDVSHIPGAVNSTLANVLATAANSEGKPIIVICYSGQSAGHAVVALRLSGYSDAKNLKWGMSGWHTTLDSWSGNVADLNHSNWTASPGAIVEHITKFDDPDIAETGTGAEILAARVTAMLNGGFKGVTSTTTDAGTGVLDAPGEFFINNYWNLASVQKYGNIAGAYRINPLTLSGEEYMFLDPSKNIVAYCWTGQTSSITTAYLTVLGYTANSLKFGINSIIHSDITDAGKKWDAGVIVDLPIAP